MKWRLAKKEGGSRVLALDPGVNLGFTLFEPQPVGPPKLLNVGTLRGRGQFWEDKTQSLFLQLNVMLGADVPGLRLVIVERPKAFCRTTAITGDQVKLDAVFGGICALAWVNRLSVLPIDIAQWKGQVPKPVSNQRTRVAMGWAVRKQTHRSIFCYPSNEHEWDAVGLACFFNRRQQKGCTEDGKT